MTAKVIVVACVCVAALSTSAFAQFPTVDACQEWSAAPVLPDLIADRQALSGYKIETKTYTDPNACEVVEGDVPGLGTHKLLRFDSASYNGGGANLGIGSPYACSRLFYEFSSCHQHAHMNGYTRYNLWTPSGYAEWTAARRVDEPIAPGSYNQALIDQAVTSGALVTGQKAGFCLMDVVCAAGGCRNGKYPRNYYDCGLYQGLSVGWGDVYGKYLDGQFIVIDGVPAGSYKLEIIINPEHILPDRNWANNFTAINVSIK